MSGLFDEVVRRSRLSPMLAPFTVTRLLVRANVDPKAVTPEALRRALPEFEGGLAAYLPAGEVEQAIAALRELTVV